VAPLASKLSLIRVRLTWDKVSPLRANLASSTLGFRVHNTPPLYKRLKSGLAYNAVRGSAIMSTILEWWNTYWRWRGNLPVYTKSKRKYKLYQITLSLWHYQNYQETRDNEAGYGRPIRLMLLYRVFNVKTCLCDMLEVSDEPNCGILWYIAELWWSTNA